ncbi:alpha/beta fold hydrolase [Actinokineospora bangkokensis]|uniref:AB hydrolase-1 domain-containing protein n=1 Tax=Actinokineospora bangkokensis TaxID=1193682 RepID=A0A1Q9LNY4_9PSEU|nr:alpha/beta hydrolase [Actinokineospora bangkokensis]OLR93725.1 hypothetical protein BJP25_15840 [Actinokineospora bangkokensis]
MNPLLTPTQHQTALDDRGTGHPFLLLHGGGGPQSVAPLAHALAATGRARVLTPTHPGFDGTPRPADCATAADLAVRYHALLAESGLSGVTVVGSSFGGWIAAEMALRAADLVRSAVLVNAVGIAVDDHPITDVAGMPLDRLADLSYHDPERFRVDPSTLPPERRAAIAANQAALAAYAGEPYMHDPGLRARLSAVAIPVHVLWGESDGIVDLDYGRAYARAIPTADFRVIPGAGHLPHVEQPELVRDLVLAAAPAR